jgi:hypothetical protein
MKTRRLVMASIVACLPIAAAVTPAGAIPPPGAPPARSGPPPYQGPLTFEQVVDEFPPPPELPPEQVQAILDSIDMNNDLTICAKGLPNAENFIDNVANNPKDS